MAVYVIAQLRFTDRPSYDRYQTRFMDVFSKYKGRLLAADAVALLVKGLAWPSSGSAVPRRSIFERRVQR